MALQTSGQITLNEIHIEAGGSSGVQCSINDTDIRGLISKGSGAQMAFSEWYGASNTFWVMPFDWTYRANEITSNGSRFLFQVFNNIVNQWFTPTVLTNSINFGFRSSYFDNSAANAVLYFGNQSGKTFKITGSASRTNWSSTPYLIARGYTSGFLSGSNSNFFLINPAGAVNQTFTVSSSYPYLILSFEIHSTQYYTDIGMNISDFVMLKL
jgi:hypothetical protein